MGATAARLTDDILPDLPTRQWVLAVPKRLPIDLSRAGGVESYWRRFEFQLAGALQIQLKRR